MILTGQNGDTVGMENKAQAEVPPLLGDRCHICDKAAEIVCQGCIEKACSDHFDEDFNYCAECQPQTGYTP